MTRQRNPPSLNVPGFPLQITFLRIFSFGSMSDVPARRRSARARAVSLLSLFLLPLHLPRALGKFPETKVRRGRIPKCGFVFPRRYLLFHGAVHRMNEKRQPLRDRSSSPRSSRFLSFASTFFSLSLSCSRLLFHVPRGHSV